MSAEELGPWIDSAGQDGNRNSMQEFATDGVQTSFEFNFAGGYIDPANVKAYVYDTTSGIKTDVDPVVLTGPNTIQVTPAPAAGNFLVVYRDTQKTVPLVDFANGAVMNETNLDLIAKQAVFNAAEMVDRFDEINASSADAIERSFTALTAAQAAVDTANSANTKADASVVTANEASVTAGTANTNAAAAVVTANGIDGKAQTALDNSVAAVNTANAANTTANGIDAKATQALEDSAQAVEDAQAAQSAAETAADAASHAMQRYLATAIPTTDQGSIYVSGMGGMEWNSTLGLYIPMSRFAECRLDGGSVANSILLSRWADGSRLTLPTGRTLIIPSAGVQVVPTGVVNGNIYYVYAYDNSGTLALEYGTGAGYAHSTDTQTGMEVKTSDRTRLLVGMFRFNGSSTLLDNNTERGVASYFNRRQKRFITAFNTTTATQTDSVISAVNTLMWAHELNELSASCRCSPTVSATFNAFGTLYISSAPISNSEAFTMVVTSTGAPWVFLGESTWLGEAATEGWYQLQFAVRVSAQTCAFVGNTTGYVTI